MNCEKAKSKIIPLINNELEIKDSEDVRNHIQGCKSCSSIYQFTLDSLNKIPFEKRTVNNPFFYDSLIAKMENQKQTKRHYLSQKITQFSIAASLVIMSIVGGTYIGSFGANILNENAKIEISETYDIMDIDLVNNDLDLFNEL
jgi:hypothetical protein